MRQEADLLVLACRRLALLGMPACIKDSSLHYVAVNDAYAALFGADARAFANSMASDVTGNAVSAERDERERRAIVFGDDGSLDFLSPDGRIYALYIEQFTTDDGQIYIYEIFEASDPVTSHQLEAANDRGSAGNLAAIKTLLDGLDQPLALKDAAGQIVLANDAYKIANAAASDPVPDATVHRLGGFQEVLEAATDCLDVGLFIIDPDNRILYRNESFARIYSPYAGDIKIGESITEMLWRAAESNFDEGFRKVDGQSIEDWQQAVMLDYQQPLLERLVETYDGRWIRIINRRLPNGYLVGLREDFTAEKARDARLLAQKSDILLLKAILDGLPVPVFARDENHLMAYSNAATASVFGKRNEEILGKDETAVFGDAAPAYYHENEDILETGRLSVGEREVINPDGTVTHMLSRTGRVVTSNDKRYVIGSMTDVSSLKMRERELVEARLAAEQIKADVLEMMNSVHYAVVVIRQSDLIIETANEAMLAHWKDTPFRSVVGHGLAELLDFHFAAGLYDTDLDGYELLKQKWVDAIKCGSVETRESILKNGVHLQILGRQISGGRVLVTFNDVTELRARDREIDDARDRFAKTGALMNEALIAMDQGMLLLSGKVIRLCNDAVGRLLKLPPQFARIGADWAEGFAYCGARGDFGDDPIALLTTLWRKSICWRDLRLYFVDWRRALAAVRNSSDGLVPAPWFC